MIDLIKKNICFYGWILTKVRHERKTPANINQSASTRHSPVRFAMKSTLSNSVNAKMKTASHQKPLQLTPQKPYTEVMPILLPTQKPSIHTVSASSYFKL